MIALYWSVLFFEPSLYSVFREVLLAVSAAYLIAAGGLAVYFLVLAPPPGGRLRSAVRLVALGTVTGLLPFPLFVVAPSLVNDAPLMPPALAALGMLLLPASLGAAILSRQFLGIDWIFRRSLVALLVWVGLLCGYGIAVDQFGDRVGVWAEDPPSGWLLFLVAVIGGTFPLAQNRLRRGVERLVFGDIYDYPQTLQQLGAEIVHLTSAERIAGHALASLGRTLDLTWAAIVLEGHGSPPCVYSWGNPPPSLIAPFEASQLHRASEIVADSLGDSAHLAPLIAEGVPIGTLAVGRKRFDAQWLPEDVSLIATLAHLVATALRNALLVCRLESQVAALARRERELEDLSLRLMRVQEEERRRLALDLHDDPLQRAILLARSMHNVPDHLQTEAWSREIDEIIDSLRAICAGLRPSVLDDLGLVAGLQVLVEQASASTNLVASLTVLTPDQMSPRRLPRELEDAFYRVAQEALNNCLKHAGASRLEVSISQLGEKTTLHVADDGQGFGSTNGNHRGGLGILGMQERLRPWNGVVTVESGAAGGAVVSAEVSLPGPGVD